MLCVSVTNLNQNSSGVGFNQYLIQCDEFGDASFGAGGGTTRTPKAIQLINSYTGFLKDPIQKPLLQIAQAVQQGLRGAAANAVLDSLLQMNSLISKIAVNDTEAQKLQQACSLMIECLRQAGAVEALHEAPASTNSKHFDAIARTFTNYGKQLTTSLEQHSGNVLAAKDNWKLILVKFNEDISSHIENLRQHFSGGARDTELVNLMFLLRRRADMHRTFLLALDGVNDQGQIGDHRLVQRNALATAAYHLTLQCSDFPKTFEDQVNGLLNTRVEIVDPTMRAEHLSVEAIIILDLVASYREGSLEGKLGQEPAIQTLGEIDVAQSKKHLEDLKFMIHPMIQMGLSNSSLDKDFIAVINEYLKCEGMRLDAIEGGETVFRDHKDDYNEAVGKYIRMISKLPSPLKDFIAVALAPCRLGKIADGN